MFISLKRRSERAFKRAFASYFLISVMVGIIADGESTIISGISDTLIVFLFVHFWIIWGYFCFKRSIPRNRQPFLPFFFCGIFLLIGSITQLPWLEKWLEGIDLLLLLLGIYSLIDEGDESPKKFGSANRTDRLKAKLGVRSIGSEEGRIGRSSSS